MLLLKIYAPLLREIFLNITEYIMKITNVKSILISLLVIFIGKLFIWTIWSQPNYITNFLAECPNFKVMYLKEISKIEGIGFMDEAYITRTLQQ